MTLVDKILKLGEEIGYLEALKELLRKGYEFDDIKNACTYNKKSNLIFMKLREECRDKNLIKKGRIKRNF